MSLLVAMFWVCTSIVVVAYLGFPIVVFVRSLFVRRPFKCDDIEPSVTMVICAYNEADGIRDKLNNVRQLDYPAAKFEVIVASDGSTDATVQLAREFEGENLHVLDLPRSGKAAALNAAVGLARNEVLIFSDANSLYAVDAVRKLVRPFADPQVGGVAGNQIYCSGSAEAGATAVGERSYWSHDRWLKQLESQSGNVVSATGAIYAIRKTLFQQVPHGVTDDFVTSTRVIAQGSRLVFAEEARCHEPTAAASSIEFGRKTRILTRGLRAVWLMRGLMNPFRFGFYALQLFCHKVLRRLVVFPLLLMALLCPCLWAAGVFYQFATLIEIVILGCALVGWGYAFALEKPPKVFAIPYYFCLVNFAVLVAVKNVLCGRVITTWTTQRGLQSPTSSPTMP